VLACACRLSQRLGKVPLFQGPAVGRIVSLDFCPLGHAVKAKAVLAETSTLACRLPEVTSNVMTSDLQAFAAARGFAMILLGGDRAAVCTQGACQIKPSGPVM